MNVHFDNSVNILKNTPTVIKALLSNLDDDLVNKNEGAGSWSPLIIVAHLIANEYANFYTRIMLTLNSYGTPILVPFDMNVQTKITQGKSLIALLNEFERVRNDNINNLSKIGLTPENLIKKAIHPTLGSVTMSQIFSTWVAHDLTHITQIVRVLAKQYKDDVGPFIEFLRILK